MPFDLLTAGFSWWEVLTLLAGLYVLGVAIFLILDNRSPQSTLAWLFILLIFPGVGIVFYIMFGRSWRAFSRENALIHVAQGSALANRFAAHMAEQPARLSELMRSPIAEYGQLGWMLWNSGQAPLTFFNRLEILQNADEKYPRLLCDIEAATKSIHLLYYEWATDSFTEEVKRLLIDKARQGVKVRALYDPVGSFAMLSRKYVNTLRRADVPIYPFSPVYQLHTLSYRNHRKIVVIDGHTAYCGGMNLTEVQLTGPKGFSGWRDTHARVTGEAAPVLQSVFATMWYNTMGENIFDDKQFPEIDDDLPRLPVQVVSAGPDSQWQTIRQSYLAMITLARKHVYIQSPFLILDDSLAEALKAATLAGIEVRLMIAPRGAELSPAYRAGMTYALEMARAGAQVFLYQGEYFHPKTICVDSTICSIGSANMDIRSFAIAYETNLVIYDEETTRELEADFHQDLANCEPFSVSEYESRPIASRFLDSVSRLGSPLL